MESRWKQDQQLYREEDYTSSCCDYQSEIFKE